MIDVSEIDLVGCFETSDEFITALSSSSGELDRYQRERDFIDRLVSGGPEPGKHGLYAGEIKRGDIISAMVESGLVRNPDSFVGRVQVRMNLGRVHQTDYWRGYSFVRQTEGDSKSALYSVRLSDVSGLTPA